MDNDDLTKARLLFSLARKRKWGKSHTAYENIFRIFRSESFGKEGLGYAKKLANGLIREGFILKKPTHYGEQVSLNPKRLKEIKKLIKDNLGFDV